MKKTSEILERFNYFLSHLRIRSSHLAKSIRVSNALISRIRAGESGITSLFALALKAEYMLNPDWLLGGEEPMFLEARGRKLEKQFNRLSGERQEEISKELKRLYGEQLDEEAKEERIKVPEVKQITNRKTKEDFFELETVPIIFYGKVAAGVPISIDNQNETLNVPNFLINGNIEEFFCLQVCGDSMIEYGIPAGSVAIFKYQSSCENGEIAVIEIKGEVTIKKVRYYKDKIELISYNKNVPSFFVKRKEGVLIKGVLKGIVKRL